jgi:hypothetical protein
MKKKRCLIFVLFFLILNVYSCDVAHKKYNGIGAEIQYSCAYWLYWYGPLLKREYPEASYNCGRDTKYEIWKSKVSPNDFDVVFTTIQDKATRFTLSFTGAPPSFVNGDFYMYPPPDRTQANEFEKVVSANANLSGSLYDVIKESDPFSETQIGNIKDWLKKYLHIKKIKKSQRFYIIPNKRYFMLVDIYWPSEKIMLEAGNASFDAPHTNLKLEKIVEMPVGDIEQSKLAKLNSNFLIAP